MPDLNLLTNDPHMKFGEVCLFNGKDAKDVEKIIEKYEKQIKTQTGSPYAYLPEAACKEIEEKTGISQITGYYYD